MKKKIDEVDMAIFDLLRKDGRMPNTEIAKTLGLSEASTRKRLKQLIDNKIIFVGAHLNYNNLGSILHGNMKIKADIKKLDSVGKQLCKIDNFLYLAALAGDIDFDADFSVKSQDELNELLNTVNNIDGIQNVSLCIRLKLMKSRYDIMSESDTYEVEG